MNEIPLLIAAGEHISNTILADLERNSGFMQETSERFSHQVEDYQIISFYETKPKNFGVKSVSQVGLLSGTAPY
jgi:hypothetical protein